MTAAASLQGRLLAVVADVFSIDRASLTLDSSRAEIAAWDSWGHVALVSAVEETFSVSIPVEEMVALETLNDLLVALQRQGLG